MTHLLDPREVEGSLVCPSLYFKKLLQVGDAPEGSSCPSLAELTAIAYAPQLLLQGLQTSDLNRESNLFAYLRITVGRKEYLQSMSENNRKKRKIRRRDEERWVKERQEKAKEGKGRNRILNIHRHPAPPPQKRTKASIMMKVIQKIIVENLFLSELTGKKYLSKHGTSGKYYMEKLAKMVMAEHILL